MKSWKTSVRPLFYAARGLWLSGSARHCILCGGSFRRFLPKGEPSRPEAMCPRCLSLERHRLLWTLIERENLLMGVSSILHFAPEPGLRARIAALPGVRYVSADLAPGRGLTAMDITRVAFRSESFDRVLCCHVLEHIPDDRAAMRELFRVLKPGGVAILQVPVREGPTDEDSGVTDPGERLRRFGQEDHLRFYGREDFRSRLAEAGFRVEVFSAAAGLSAAEIERGRLSGGADEDFVFVCRKGS